MELFNLEATSMDSIFLEERSRMVDTLCEGIAAAGCGFQLAKFNWLELE